jgi:hypothetical protein
VAEKRLHFVTSEQIGPKRRLVHGGYLLCEDVPIARIGTLMYAAGEVDVAPTADGMISVERHPEDVFAQSAIDSFQAQPIVDEHPVEDGEVIGVDPTNWRSYAVGTMLNPRRGDGAHFDNDFLYADLLFQDADAIRAVMAGKKEVSLGYDADYEQLGPGRGRQRNIIGNHIALVDRGRCGPRCAIGDSAANIQRGQTQMAARTVTVDRNLRRRVNDALARVRRKLGTSDAEMAALDELEKIPEMLGEDPLDTGSDGGAREGTTSVTVNLNGAVPQATGGTADAVDPAAGADPAAAAGAGDAPDLADHPMIKAMLERLASIEAMLMSLADDDDDDGEPVDPSADPAAAADPNADRMPTGDTRRSRVGDSTSMTAAFTDMIARAEVLAPGMSMPTFDSASPARSTFDAMCGFRRRVLRAAYADERGKKAIEPFLTSGTVAFHDSRAMTCDSIAMAFNGASTLLMQESPLAGRGLTDVNGFKGSTVTAADLNKKFAKLRGETV